MKKAFFLLVSLLIFNQVVGSNIDTATAKTVAKNFFGATYPAAIQKHLTDFSLVYQANTHQKSGETNSLFYVFNAGSEGFIIVAANDRVKPILAYSNETPFDPTNIPPNTAWWLSSYEQEIEYAINNNIAATPSITQQWQSLISGNILMQKSHKNSGAPLITTKWGQGNRYNSLCPYDTAVRAYCATGCVVVAMSQVMNYWEHPVKGLGSHSYVDHPFGVLSADFENTTYLYDSMPTSLYSSTRATQIHAVATLMYHCGVSIDIDYGVYGSNASLAEYTAGSPSAELALKTFFGYPDVIGLNRSQYSEAQWVQIIKNEIDSARPVLYRGSGDVGGHAFVFDAYNDSDYFHVNWGWTGYADGYFLVSALNPMSYSFPNGHYILINIKPTQHTIIPDTNHIVYITPSGAGKKDGSSWDNASPHLSFAVKRPYASPTQIWVKSGTYYGDTTLETAFQIAANNKVYGGFAGNEPANFNINLRNFTQNTSILDGQHKQRVVATAGATDTNRSICDGFILQNGYTETGGAGAFMNGGKLSNCIIRNNTNDSSYGGGVYVIGKAILVNCNIYNNTAIFGGGAMIWDTTYLVNCNFVNNTVTSNGGGIYVGDTCFAVNCIFWGNKRNTYANQIANSSNTLTDISFSAIQGGYTGSNNINLNASNDGIDTFYYVRFSNPTLNDFTLSSTSSCIDAGDVNAKNIEATDLSGLRRIKNGQIDMGAYEYGCYTNNLLTDTACGGSLYEKYGFYQHLNNTGNLTLVQKTTGANDCDSIVTLKLNVLTSDIIELEDAVCLGERYTSYGFDTIPVSVGTLLLQHHLFNSYGCDSILNLKLHVSTTDNVELYDTLCHGEVYIKNGFEIHSDTLTTGSFLYNFSTFNMYGCDSNITLYLTVHPINDTVINDEVYQGETYNNNGFLIHTDTLSTGTFMFTQNALNRYGCDSIIHLQLKVSVGINEIQAENNIIVYPNPANAYLDIQCNNIDLQNIEACLCDITGKVISKIFLQDRLCRMDISLFAKGMYFLKIQTDKHTLRTIKVIKQ